MSSEDEMLASKVTTLSLSNSGDTNPFVFTEHRGFLPVKDPIRRLSSSEYAAWEDAADALPSLLAAMRGDQAREYILNLLPEFNAAALISAGDTEQLWRAMSVISFICHAYIWNDADKPASTLPEKLAVPWCAISKSLDMPPVIFYSTYCLLNWRRLDPRKPIELGNIVCINNFFGGIDEEWFRLVHIDIEAKAGQGVQAIFDAQEAVSQNDVTKVGECLAVISSTLERMQQVLNRMGEKCDPHIYFHRVRAFMKGWRDNPSLPDGMLYEGVDTERKFFYGETGAQSSIVPACDAALGVVHEPGWLSDYVKVALGHMPPPHRRLIEKIELGPSIRNFVSLHLSELAGKYDKCLLEVFQFRNLHKSFAHSYIHRLNAKEIGTGGTDFMPYLGGHAVTTKNHYIRPAPLQEVKQAA